MTWERTLDSEQRLSLPNGVEWWKRLNNGREIESWDSLVLSCTVGRTGVLPWVHGKLGSWDQSKESGVTRWERWASTRVGNLLLSILGFQGGALDQLQPLCAPESLPAQRGLGMDCCQCHSAPVVRDLELDSPFIFLFDLKHVQTRNVTSLCVTEMRAKRWQLLWPWHFFLSQQLVFGGDQALSACHFQ